MHLSLACYGLQFVDLLGGKILVFCIMVFPAKFIHVIRSVVAVSEYLPCSLICVLAG